MTGSEIRAAALMAAVESFAGDHHDDEAAHRLRSAHRIMNRAQLFEVYIRVGGPPGGPPVRG